MGCSDLPTTPIGVSALGALVRSAAAVAKQKKSTPRPPQYPRAKRPNVPPASGGRNTRLLLYAGVAAVVLVAAVAAGVLASRDGGSGVGEGRVATHVDGVPQDGRVLGRPSAPVMLVEYADLQCPFCAQFALDVLPELVRRYVRPGRVKIEFRGLAFIGEDSQEALAHTLAAADDDRLWQTTDLLYQSQGPENSGWVTDDLLDDIATSAGLDPDAVRERAESAEVAAQVEEDAESAGRLDIASTPSFLVGPTGGSLRRIELTALTPDEFVAILDEELAAAS